MNPDEDKQKKLQALITQLLEQGILLSPELLAEENRDQLLEKIPSFLAEKSSAAQNCPLIITPDTFSLKPGTVPASPLFVPSASELTPPLPAVSSEQASRPAPASSLTISISYENIPQKYAPAHFTALFLSRYRFLENLLRGRRELQGVITICRLLEKKDKDRISLIALVTEISETKKGHLLLTVEDPTGKLTILVSQENKALMATAKEIVPDEVLGILGTAQKDFFVAEDFFWPDLPLQTELKKSDQDQSVVFLSDIHVGSKLFLEKEFKKFLQWLRGDFGTAEQREMSKKVAYVVIAGDVVDGVGIYPSQEEELAITDIREQYRLFAQLLTEISPDKHIVICPGNHDMVHLAEPQPIFYKDIAPELHQLPHVTLVTNPAVITIGKTPTFSGFDILMYHGYSFDYYVAQVEALRNRGGYRRADLIMQFLLKRRHLAPTFGSTPYFPGHKEDPLLIRKIPDFFVSGHIHYSCVAHYRGVTLISGSCWQGKTSFQEKLGHEPEPGRVPVINLQTREVKILRFI